MAEDKKEADSKAEGAKKKKGLPPFVLIAVGAIVGGAGVVFAVPPKTVEVPQPVKVYEPLDGTHPDSIQHEFNPPTQPCKGIAPVALRYDA